MRTVEIKQIQHWNISFIYFSNHVIDIAKLRAPHSHTHTPKSVMEKSKTREKSKSLQEKKKKKEKLNPSPKCFVLYATNALSQTKNSLQTNNGRAYQKEIITKQNKTKKIAKKNTKNNKKPFALEQRIHIRIWEIFNYKYVNPIVHYLVNCMCVCVCVCGFNDRHQWTLYLRKSNQNHKSWSIWHFVRNSFFFPSS